MDNFNKADTWIEIERIKEDTNNPRKIFSIQHIEGLAQSIKQEGLINPLEIDENFIIITGHCRFRAAQLLNWKKVPVRINPTTYSDYERLRHQVSENVHQSGEGTPMNPIDTANSYVRLLKLLGYNFVAGAKSQGINKGISQLEREIGVSETAIREHLKLLEEPEFVQKALREGLPRTYISRAELAPVEVQEGLKMKIAQGDYQSRTELDQDIQILKQLPDLGQLELERKRAKENAGTNRILNGVARLGLALEALSFEQIDVREQGIVKNQLEWLLEKINNYLHETN